MNAPVTPAAAPATYSELMASAAAICSAQPGFGTPAYRGDPADAVALQQQAERLVYGMAERIVAQDVCYCVSSLVSTLLQGATDSDALPLLDDDDASALAGREPDADDYRDACDVVDGRPIITVEASDDDDGPWRWTWSDGDDSDAGNGFATEVDAWRDAFDRTDQEHPDGPEAYEHWLVTGWLADKLKAHGESVVDDVLGLTIWARCTTGQAISMDSVVQRIARDVLA